MNSGYHISSATRDLTAHSSGDSTTSRRVFHSVILSNDKQALQSVHGAFPSQRLECRNGDQAIHSLSCPIDMLNGAQASPTLYRQILMMAQLDAC